MNAKHFQQLERAHAQSGLSIASFCRKRGIALSTFHYWRRRFRAAEIGNFVELRLRGKLLPRRPVLRGGRLA